MITTRHVLYRVGKVHSNSQQTEPDVQHLKPLNLWSKIEGEIQENNCISESKLIYFVSQLHPFHCGSRGIKACCKGHLAIWRYSIFWPTRPCGLLGQR